MSAKRSVIAIQKKIDKRGQAMTRHIYPFAPDHLVHVARGLPPRQQLHRATVEGHLHSGEIRILENSRHAVVIEYFYLQMNARGHDFRGARCMKVDGVTSLFPRLDGASDGFAFDLVSDR